MARGKKRGTLFISNLLFSQFKIGPLPATPNSGGSGGDKGGGGAAGAEGSGTLLRCELLTRERGKKILPTWQTRFFATKKKFLLPRDALESERQSTHCRGRCA